MAEEVLSQTNPVPRGEAERDLHTPDPVFTEAKRRFEYCQETEAYARDRFLDDLKFAEADADNGYQWPNDLRRSRDIEDRPCLTINITRQHNLQIINDSRQNKPSVRIRPTGGGASKEAADAYQDIVRHIEYISNAHSAYDKATGFQVKAGYGAWRVVTDYSSDESFDQEIYIRPINDPLSVYIDPDAQEADKSDANYAFIYRNFSKSIFETIYPQWKNELGSSPLGNDGDHWLSKDHVRVVEYFRRIQVEDELVNYKDPETSERVATRASKLAPEILETLKAPENQQLLQTQTRIVWDTKVEWYLIVGKEVKMSTSWLGKYIPIVVLIGEETIIEGTLDRKGHTRAIKDPQRIYNYWNSSAVEQVALQSKTPWTAPAAAIEGFETYWNTANRVNHSVLPWKHIDDEGGPIPEPKRQMPPEMGQAYIQGLQISAQDIAKVSGQNEASFGQESNERTGRAIAERARRGQNATYHFIDNLSVAIRHTGKILLDLIPKVYDTQRLLRITAEDGSEYEMMIDPSAKQAFQAQRDSKGNVIARILNPTMGNYEVESDIGPNYASRREEAWNAYSIILTQAPQLTGVIGDLLFRAGDFPFAEEAAARLKKMVPNQATGGPSQEVLELQTQLQNTQNALAAALNDIAAKTGELKAQGADLEIKEYDAETKRLAAVLKLLVGGEMSDSRDGSTKVFPGLKTIVAQLVQDTMQTNITKSESTPSAPPMVGPAQGAPGGTPGVHQMGASPPVPGAKMAPDGHWYLPDDQRPGKYLKVLGGTKPEAAAGAAEPLAAANPGGAAGPLPPGA